MNLFLQPQGWYRNWINSVYVPASIKPVFAYVKTGAETVIRCVLCMRVSLSVRRSRFSQERKIDGFFFNQMSTKKNLKFTDVSSHRWKEGQSVRISVRCSALSQLRTKRSPYLTGSRDRFGEEARWLGGLGHHQQNTKILLQFGNIFVVSLEMQTCKRYGLNKVSL